MGKKDTYNYNNGHKLKCQKRNHSKKEPIIILSLLLVIIAVGCVIYFTNNNKVAKTDATAQKSTSSKSIGSAESTTVKAKTVMEQLDSKEWYLTYVNKDNKIPDDYIPETSTIIEGNSQELDSRVVPYYVKMYNAAKEDGCSITPYSGYRSYSHQSKNYNNKVSYYESKGYDKDKAKAAAATIILPPGTSEHNLGFSMDIVSADANFANTEEFKWLNEHAADYGFVLRYPKDKTDITGITYEPWHWRYVGEKAAKEMKKTGECFEEYLGLAK